MTVAQEISGSILALRDVAGVQGSFVIADDGQIVARDMPAYIEDGVISDVAPRLSRLHESLSSSGSYLETCVLHFSDQRLYARKVPEGFVCMLLVQGANLPALRMAVNLVARRIAGQMTSMVERERNTGPVRSSMPERRSSQSLPVQHTPPAVQVPAEVTRERPSVPRRKPAPRGAAVRMYRGTKR